MKRLMVAAGGGGDALASAMLHAAQHGDSEPALILTYAWDRLLIDPLPGPRRPGDFTGLDEVAPGVLVFRPTTQPTGAAGSTLPRQSAIIHAELALLDPHDGAAGMTAQINAAIRYTRADRIDIIDVGGDAIARGNEPELRSPLADALSLSACADVDVPTALIVAGPGLDGELPESDVLARFGGPFLHLTAERTSPFLHVFEWHPSEATALLAAAAHGVRGTCEVREAGLPVRLTDASPRAYRLDLDDALEINELSHRLIGTTSLTEAEQITREVCGFSELDHERTKALWLKGQEPKSDTIPDDFDATLSAFLAQAAARGSDYVTYRRIAEALNLSQTALTDVRRQLTNSRPGKGPSLVWPTAPNAA